MKAAFFTFLIALVPTFAWAGTSQPTLCADEASFPVVTKASLQDMIQNKQAALIVDVNSAESFAKVHVPGAIHYAAHEKDFESLLPRDKTQTIVAYCGGVKCGAWHKAAERACKAGYTHVLHYKEGISGWVSSSNSPGH